MVDNKSIPVILRTNPFEFRSNSVIFRTYTVIWRTNAVIFRTTLNKSWDQDQVTSATNKKVYIFKTESCHLVEFETDSTAATVFCGSVACAMHWRNQLNLTVMYITLL